MSYEDERLEESRRFLRNDEAQRFLAECQLKMIKALLSNLLDMGEDAYREEFCTGEYAEYKLADIDHAKSYAKLLVEKGQEQADQLFIAHCIELWKEMCGEQPDRN